VKANHLANVHANHLALTSKDGPRKLYLASQDGIGCNSMAPPVNFSGREVEVPCVTLDEYLAQHNVARVDFIKMDVEGAELLVLQGGEALFQRPDKPIMILEFEEARQKAFGNSCTKLYEFLHARGYQLYRLVDGELSPYKPGPGDPVTFNVLAVPEARMDALANVKRA
jgi:FkbM family methyltransferase